MGQAPAGWVAPAGMPLAAAVWRQPSKPLSAHGLDLETKAWTVSMAKRRRRRKQRCLSSYHAHVCTVGGVHVRMAGGAYVKKAGGGVHTQKVWCCAGDYSVMKVWCCAGDYSVMKVWCCAGDYSVMKVWWCAGDYSVI